MNRIALVGMMGSGKTTVGRVLAEHLNLPFVDLDAFIETRAGRPIPQLFAEKGEAGFRAWEERALRRITQACAGVVLATGGGVVVTEGCRQILSSRWCTVWLDARVETLVERLRDEADHRPMLATSESLAERVAALSEARAAWYGAVARRRVAVDGRSALSIAHEIAAWMETEGCRADAGR
ncbi:shikimate kinase [Alicyclobacillus sp.]|uniref:shikimate kinase n=1 Tax=Alicyclobacillus sp. TaxID=61169 RepID=UPI0025B8FDEC|nr:shikimate kinase [Alicyclobacillus sp.]MCL6516175.1 shikimate kinase [Alicyclobacillus sp.]